MIRRLLSTLSDRVSPWLALAGAQVTIARLSLRLDELERRVPSEPLTDDERGMLRATLHIYEGRDTHTDRLIASGLRKLLGGER